ncbi:glycosyltransferase [Williamsia maris]|uniref:Glycosyltransferase involved in cell wall bisynthesis n=1 Tax=Williamsia maris TaxID=72806 RepID=A0ABT1HD75_9NOCA|nr:glycosyltransferase [Williamsia maris]MCP2175631.1 Glycosyltransferase involved in cell wall bisynthesis [Williamsia maris]
MNDPLSLPGGHWVVPGNRWDLVPDEPRPPATVTVVVPHYRQQAQLDRLLEALTLQTHPASLLQVVIADDGSPTPPDVGAYRDRLDLTVVRQADHGFRAAAARNLGASAADGEILCFLDADTVPEPAYVENATRLPAAVPDALTVGRRRHADLTGWDPTDLRAWFSEGADAPPELTEPGWLRDAYAGSRDLLDADRRSYRFIISAVMTCARSLFDEVGRFEESFTSYGGEDWEFAHRAFDAGAVFAHVRDAVAWHDGPDWAERTGEDRQDKNLEAMALAPLVTDPAARTHGVVYAVPQTVAIVDTTDHSAASLLVTVGSLVTSGDTQVWISGPDAAALRAQWGDVDARIHVGVPENTRRSRFVVEVRGRVRLGPGSLDRLIDLVDSTDVGRVVVGAQDAPALTLTTSRSAARARRWAGTLDVDTDDLADDLFGTAVVGPADVDISDVELHPRLAW